MKPTPALARLEKKLTLDPCAILDVAETRLLHGEVRRDMISSFPGVEPYLDRSEDTIRWHALARGTQRLERREVCARSRWRW
jgi:hypothetical protein